MKMCIREAFWEFGGKAVCEKQVLVRTVVVQGVGSEMVTGMERRNIEKIVFTVFGEYCKYWMVFDLAYL